MIVLFKKYVKDPSNDFPKLVEQFINEFEERIPTEAEKQMVNKNIDELEYEIDLLTGKINILSISTILNKIGFPDNWEGIID